MPVVYWCQNILMSGSSAKGWVWALLADFIDLQLPQSAMLTKGFRLTFIFMKGKGKRYLSLMAFTSISLNSPWPLSSLAWITPDKSSIPLATPHKHTHTIFRQTHKIIPMHPGHSQGDQIIFHIKENHITAHSRFFNSSPG